MIFPIKSTYKIVIFSTDGCPFNICQIQIHIKRYNRICFSIVLACIYIPCKLQQLFNRTNARFNRFRYWFFALFRRSHHREKGQTQGQNKGQAYDFFH